MFKSQIISLETGHDIVDVLFGELGPRSDQSLLCEQQAHFSEDQHFEFSPLWNSNISGLWVVILRLGGYPIGMFPNVLT